jgi:hypothetical protein
MITFHALFSKSKVQPNPKPHQNRNQIQYFVCFSKDLVGHLVGLAKVAKSELTR